MDLKEVLNKSKKKERVDVTQMTEREKQLVEELIDAFCQYKGESKTGEFATKIKQQYQIESLNEYDITKSLWHKAAEATGLYYQRAGWVDVGLGTKDAIRYPIVGFSDDVRKMDALIAYCIANFK